MSNKARLIDAILNSEPHVPAGYDPEDHVFHHPGSPYARGTPIPPEEIEEIERKHRERKAAKRRERWGK